MSCFLSLYPLPEIPQEPLRVMLSFGYIQMMTDAMKPLGISTLQTMFPKSVFLEAGGRLFIDLTELLRTRFGGKMFPVALRNVFDEKLSNAIREVIERPEFREVPAKRGFFRSKCRLLAPIIKNAWKNLWKRDSKLARDRVEDYMQKKMAVIQEALQGASGHGRLKEVQVLDGLVKEIVQNIVPYVFPAIISSILLKKFLIRLTGDDGLLYKLNQSLPGNITSRMGLEIGDLADLVRELPEVEAYLKQAKDETFYEGLLEVGGGERFKQAFEEFMGKYGHRCPGEIDLTRPRWREVPCD